MLRLFLENHEIELNENVQVAITKQFEDITNPTAIINDWSKTVKIPGSANNDKIFGHIFNIDRLIVGGNNSLMGIYFDPYKKIDFRLQWGSTIIMTGYAKMTDVVKSKNKSYYNITLNGELGKVFQEMKKITFDRNTDDQNYLIEGEKYVSEKINKELVHKTWNNAPDLTSPLRKIGDTGYKVYDIIGFAPNNAYDDNFDYSIYEKGTETIKFTDTLEGENEVFKTATGVGADEILKDGITPRGIGEFRSYLQLPYIYFNKLFNIFIEKAKEITGYDIILDDNWFNPKNIFWSKLVYMLKKFQTKESANAVTDPITTEISNVIQSWYPVGSPLSRDPGWTKEKYLIFTFYNGTTQISNFPIPDVINNVLNIQIDDIVLYVANFKGPTGMNPNNPLLLTLTISGDSVFEQKYVFLPAGYNTWSADPTAIVLNYVKFENNYLYLPKIDLYAYVDRNTFGSSVKIGGKFKFYSEANPTIGGTVTAGGNTDSTIRLNYANSVGLVNINSFTDTFRSNTNFTLNELWDNQHNVFTEILNYCKMFRIMVLVNYFDKTITFKHYKDYFDKYTIEDWTNKLDLSRDYTIKPLTFENKYVLFNYEDVDTELNNQYKTKYGLNYGELKLTTDYNFNDDKKDLFKGVKPSIAYTDPILSWNNLYINKQIIYTFPNEVYPYNKNSDNKSVDLFGSLFFFKGLSQFDTNPAANLRKVNISDDTTYQLYNNLYCYSQYSDMITSTKYPKLDIYEEDNLITFNNPMENYTAVKPNKYNGYSVYTSFWKKYLNERYNIQNKLLTCYLDITPTDYINFDFNKFIKIQNQLYIVNKIYDYDITNTTTTKVDLITVQSLDGYRENNYNSNYFYVYNSQKEEWDYYSDYITLTEVGDTKTIYVSSNKPITWKDTNSALQSMSIYYNNDTSTARNGSGTIPAGTMVPVTFRMDELYYEMGDILFSSSDIDVKVSVALEFDSSFTVYDSDRTAWTNTDKVELENTGPLTKTIYITSPNSDVEWQDLNGNLRDLYVSYNNDSSTEKRGNGVIPAGTMVPVTFRMVEEGDVFSSIGYIRLSTERQSSDIDVRIYYNEIFEIYRWDGQLWDSNYDYILLEPSDSTKTIYLTANSEVEWSDESGELQNLWINVGGDPEDWGEYENGRGIISPGNRIPIHFRLDTDGMETGSTGNVVFFNGRHDWFVNVTLR